ncbi:NAD(P)/FAD-dependent oxidoreductase [Niabella terrae]
MTENSYDAFVVGAGPNGLASAITLQQAGLSVLLLEGKEQIGGGTRTAAVTLPGFLHDICSAVHPMAVHSPFLASLPLEEFGLEFLHSPIVTAHPFDGGRAALVSRSLEATAASLGADKMVYYDLIEPVVQHWDKIVGDILGPLKFPRHPVPLAAFGLKALQPASSIARRFQTREAKALWAGMAGHSIQPLSNATTSAIGLVLAAAAHNKGWPIARQGSQSITNAMAAYFTSIGGVIETNRMITHIDELPAARITLFDVTPRQLLKIAGHRFSALYKWQLQRYRYGMGVFKVDWALSEPIPFTSLGCRKAATVHIGGSYEEIAYSESEAGKGNYVERPFVMLAQQSQFDATRAPEGKHTAWAYCHVPHGAQRDMTTEIENQIERFAPGFRETILSKKTMNAMQMQLYNPNYIGGDINGGILDIRQLYTRPALRISPYRTSAKGIYICSSSTPPGGGVHGMNGYHAARTALNDVYGIKV